MSFPRFASYLYVDDLPELRGAVHDLATSERARGNIVRAAEVEAAYARLVKGLEALAFEVSVKGTETLRKVEKRTRVGRPEAGSDGGPKLGDSLLVEPIAPGLPGSVGIANYDVLDNLQDSEGRTGWWVVNEVGGQPIPAGGIYRTGLFQPGDSAASGALDRQHALFKPLSAGEGGAPMVIRKPVPARRFIERSVPEILAVWRRGCEALRDQFYVELGW